MISAGFMAAFASKIILHPVQRTKRTRYISFLQNKCFDLSRARIILRPLTSIFGLDFVVMIEGHIEGGFEIVRIPGIR